MAKPIKLGMVLENEDARRFEEYLLKPDCTPKGKSLILESSRRAQTFQFK